ncbi:MAG: penicillin-binding protein 2 [Syntrophomonadaceae bacterium]|nr:penicillin-binding protein 2 [Syntrophomonadaceae bacterium]
MKPKTIQNRLKVYSYIVIALLAILCIRLAVVQFFHQQVYQTQAKENRIRLVAVKAPRGEIYDRNGEKLANNELVYTLSLSYLGLKGQDNVVDHLTKLLQSYYPEIDKDYIEEKISLQKYRLFEPLVIVRDIPWDLVVEIEENRRTLPGVTITVEPLRAYPEGGLAGHVLGYIHSINAEELANNEESKYSINSLIGKSGIEKQYEKELRGKDGARRVEVDANGRPVRELVTLEPLPGNNLYLTLDMELQKVLEKSMDEVLQQLQKQHPKAKVGSAIVINVKTGEILAMCSRPALNPDDWKGKLSNEKASYYYPPGKYNPMNPGAETNRAIQDSYPPGSTFKPITGMAALDKSSLDPSSLVNCGGAYWIKPNIKCTGVHGNVNYYSGMAKSCNTYFQEIGRRTGKDNIIHVAREFGLGSKTGIDLPDESQGLLPTPQWKKEINEILLNNRYAATLKRLDEKYTTLEQAARGNQEELEKLKRQKQQEKIQIDAEHDIRYRFDTNWQDYDTFNMSIGQGYNDYTVIQIANYIAAIANGGYLMRPHVMKSVVSNEGKVLKTAKPEVINEVDISPEAIAMTRRAMLAVTQPGGTAHFLFAHFPPDILIATKTGTVETGRQGDNQKKEFHGVFVAFAPFDDPEIAFASVIEYGYHGSTSAGYVARDVFEHYYGIKDHLADEKAQVEEEEDGTTNQSTENQATETDPRLRPR